VLAIGLLVDDAIVVVEHVERVMTDEHLPPRETTQKAMGQITGAPPATMVISAAVACQLEFNQPGVVLALRNLVVDRPAAVGDLGVDIERRSAPCQVEHRLQVALSLDGLPIDVEEPTTLAAVKLGGSSASETRRPAATVRSL